MTEDHQNVNVHNVTYMFVANRTSGHHLTDRKQAGSVLSLENPKCLPSAQNKINQRNNLYASWKNIEKQQWAKHLKYDKEMDLK